MVKNYRFLTRPVLYTNMKVGKMSPMDGDAILDLFGKAMLFFEVKCRHAAMPLGQRICLQNLVNNTREDRMAAVVLCDCHDDNPDNPIDLASCTARQVYEGGAWRSLPPMSVREFTDTYTARVCEKYGLASPVTA